MFHNFISAIADWRTYLKNYVNKIMSNKIMLTQLLNIICNKSHCIPSLTFILLIIIPSISGKWKLLTLLAVKLCIKNKTVIVHLYTFVKNQRLNLYDFFSKWFGLSLVTIACVYSFHLHIYIASKALTYLVKIVPRKITLCKTLS